MFNEGQPIPAEQLGIQPQAVNLELEIAATQVALAESGEQCAHLTSKVNFDTHDARSVGFTAINSQGKRLAQATADRLSQTLNEDQIQTLIHQARENNGDYRPVAHYLAKELELNQLMPLPQERQTGQEYLNTVKQAWIQGSGELITKGKSGRMKMTSQGKRYAQKAFFQLQENNPQLSLNEIGQLFQTELGDSQEARLLRRSLAGKTRHEQNARFLAEHGGSERLNCITTSQRVKNVVFAEQLAVEATKKRETQANIQEAVEEEIVSPNLATRAVEKTKGFLSGIKERFQRKKAQLDQENEALMAQALEPEKADQALGGWKAIWQKLRKPAERTATIAVAATCIAGIAWGLSAMFPSQTANALETIGLTPPPATHQENKNEVALGGQLPSVPPSVPGEAQVIDESEQAESSIVEQSAFVKESQIPIPPPAVNESVVLQPEEQIPSYKQEAYDLASQEGEIIQIPDIPNHGDLDGRNDSFTAPIHQVEQDENGALPDLLLDSNYADNVGSYQMPDGRGVHLYFHDRGGLPGLSGRLSAIEQNQVFYIGGRPWQVILKFTKPTDTSVSWIYWRASRKAYKEKAGRYVLLQSCDNADLGTKVWVVAAPIDPDNHQIPDGFEVFQP
jgi:hypothetical protein